MSPVILIVPLGVESLLSAPPIEISKLQKFPRFLITHWPFVVPTLSLKIVAKVS
jgi:hypothetical protein